MKTVSIGAYSQPDPYSGLRVAEITWVEQNQVIGYVYFNDGRCSGGPAYLAKLDPLPGTPHFGDWLEELFAHESEICKWAASFL